MTETAAHLYRIGVVGPAATGKSLLLSGFHELVKMECPVCSAAARCSAGASGSVDDSLHDVSGHAADTNVFSVVVKEKGTLGIKIAKHKKYSGFVCVKAFVQDESTGALFELERSGKVSPGDLLVAVNRQSLLNMPQEGITNILKNDSSIRVLTFLRTGGGSPHSQSMDASVSALGGGAGVAPISVEGGHRCQCSTWRTCTEVADVARCLEIVEFPGTDTTLSLLRSHMSGLDGIVFVYSLEMMSSLLMLEKRYARSFPGLLSSAKMKARGIEEFPLVVVGTVRECMAGAASPVADPVLSARAAESQRQLLLAEGNTFAEVWGAPPVIEAPIGFPNDGNILAHMSKILQCVIERIDATDDPSCFVSDDASSSLGLSCFFPMCFGDSATNDSDPTVDTSIDGAGESPAAITNNAKLPRAKPKRRKETRKLRPYAGFESVSSPWSIATVQEQKYPSEETPFSRSSSKFLRYIISSCE